MLNEENFNMIIPHPVGDDISEISENEFARPFNFAAASQKSILRQKPQRPPVD